MEIIFALIMFAGVGYLLLSIFGGLADTFDLGLDSALETLGIDSLIGLEGIDAKGLGCSVIAAFMAGFGAVGFVGTRAGWGLILSLLIALALGMVLARVVAAVFRYVYLGQSTAVQSNEWLVGKNARVTIDTPAGSTGEAMIEVGEVAKYSIKEIDGQALQRGDTVEIIDIVNDHLLRVKKH